MLENERLNRRPIISILNCERKKTQKIKNKYLLKQDCRKLGKVIVAIFFLKREIYGWYLYIWSNIGFLKVLKIFRVFISGHSTVQPTDNWLLTSVYVKSMIWPWQRTMLEGPWHLWHTFFKYFSSNLGWKSFNVYEPVENLDTNDTLNYLYSNLLRRKRTEKMTS